MKITKHNLLHYVIFPFLIFVITIVIVLPLFKGPNIVKVAMTLYILFRILNQIIGDKDEKGVIDNFWLAKATFYIALGIGTLVANSNMTTLTLAAMIAFIEAFDLVFENWLKHIVDNFKPKIHKFFKSLCIAAFGYRLCGLRKLILYFKKHKI